MNGKFLFACAGVCMGGWLLVEVVNSLSEPALAMALGMLFMLLANVPFVLILAGSHKRRAQDDDAQQTVHQHLHVYSARNGGQVPLLDVDESQRLMHDQRRVVTREV